MVVENENTGSAIMLRQNDNNGGRILTTAENAKLVECEQNNYLQTVNAIS